MRRALHAAWFPLLACLLGACGEGEEAKERPSLGPAPEAAAAEVTDAGAADEAAPAAAPEAVPAPPAPLGGEDLDGFHLDSSQVDYEVPEERPAPEHPPRPIEIVLRSTPPGARAAVDGVPAGRTPTLWRGTADGRPREFTFVLPGYGMARYRFPPTRGGVVHGTLRKIAVEQADAGPPN